MKLLLSPTTLIAGATAIANQPPAVGTVISVPMSIESIDPVAVAPGKTFWAVRLAPHGADVAVDDRRVWIEVSATMEVAP